MKKKEAITNNLEENENKCDFCNRTFKRSSTLLSHICEYKHRWQEKDKRGNTIGFQCWLEFNKRNTTSKKIKTYEDFIKNNYYIAFVKFGNYCVSINCINVSRYIDWLFKNKIKIDTWTSDQTYTKFLVEFIRTEDPYDAIKRSIQTIIELSEVDRLQVHDYLRYGNKNKICYNITKGKISPWLLYQSESGVKFLESLAQDQIKIVFDYINPELWAIRFLKDPDIVDEIKNLLKTTGY